VLASVKILILFLIIVAGLRALRGDLSQIPDPASSLKSPFTGSSSSVSHYTNALFKILATYQGWSNAAYVLDEVKNPRKVLKIAGFVGVGTVGILYTLTNISYFIVATPDEISKTGVTVVALLIGKVFGDTMLWLTATLAALSSFGNLMTASFTMSRVAREFAREGIVPYSRFFAATTSSGSPSAAFLLVFLSSTVMILFIPFGQLVSLFGLSVLKLTFLNRGNIQFPPRCQPVRHRPNQRPCHHRTIHHSSETNPQAHFPSLDPRHLFIPCVPDFPARDAVRARSARHGQSSAALAVLRGSASRLL
jgi:amino acid transporter